MLNHLPSCYAEQDAAVLRTVTSRVTAEANNPAWYIREHFAAILRSKSTQNGNAARGRWLEACVYSAMCERPWRFKTINHGYHIDKRRNVEADFLVSQVVVHVKTSVRERWKQVDRDAMLIEQAHPSYAQYLLIYLEHEDDDVEKSMHRVEKLNEKWAAPVKAVSVFDDRSVALMFKAIRKRQTET